MVALLAASSTQRSKSWAARDAVDERPAIEDDDCQVDVTSGGRGRRPPSGRWDQSDDHVNRDGLHDHWINCPVARTGKSSRTRQSTLDQVQWTDQTSLRRHHYGRMRSTVQPTHFIVSTLILFPFNFEIICLPPILAHTESQQKFNSSGPLMGAASLLM